MQARIFDFPLPTAAMGHGDNAVLVFFAQVMLLIILGRLLGEAMQRMKQPAVIGQLLAGIILGPSVFGTLWPGAHAAIFPAHSSERPMLSAVSELGVLMLLLVTGMETDLALVKRVRRTAAITSIAGIAFPFACGYILGELLPASLLPDPNRRLITSLFLATALSISSVKIVAAVLQEVDFLRRNLGQIILAAAILDDTAGWTILALIGGLAAQGKIVLGPVLISVFGTIAFLLFCFTIGRHIVARIIRWTNDNFIIEMPVISLILVLMIALALVTNAIGVHTVLGAFAAGIMIGQSPILTKHIQEELRGMIVALFMPVFFGVAGLSIDLKVLRDPQLLGLAVLLIAVASLGKLGGCYVGGLLGRLHSKEALAVAFAMNARGSTEVILATVGLSMGVLDQKLFTLIVLMAVVTTLCMPPLLRWALARVPLREEEKKRMEAEAAEKKDFMPKLERALVGLDQNVAGHFAATLAGLLIGSRHLTATVMEAGETSGPGEGGSVPSKRLLETARRAARQVEAGQEKAMKDHPPERDPLEAAAHAAHAEQTRVEELISIVPLKKRSHSSSNTIADGILAEAKNGYDLLYLGIGGWLPAKSAQFPPAVEQIVRDFKGSVAIFCVHESYGAVLDTPLTKILVPTTGADYSRFGAEVAVAVAKGCTATVTALHVSLPSVENQRSRRTNESTPSGRAIIDDMVALAHRESVHVVTKILSGPVKENAILNEAIVGEHQLIVLGTKQRPGDALHFGESVSAIIENAPCPVLIVTS
ncbi:MAG: cation:proton antiporter [Chthoniobacter sp.]|uniref:cation:proton antiporter domain-containing protein n=1 Tax=Chthoniobacter sp. TaxID=2510640 RepID=UPI0032A2B03A